MNEESPLQTSQDTDSNDPANEKNFDSDSFQGEAYADVFEGASSFEVGTRNDIILLTYFMVTNTV